MSQVLVVNAGSSSLKYALVEPSTGEQVTSGTIEKIGQPGEVVDHDAAFEQVSADLAGLPDVEPVAVGHRVVHGGDQFSQPVRIDDRVIAAIEECVPLAPLHNPPALTGIRAARAAFPDVPHVAVFDTAFHSTMPVEAYTYAIDADVAAEHKLRRYGFHGTSHAYVSARAAAFLGRDVAELKMITLHLGNGASACAIDGGRSIDTSMGVTPLEGLVMGTRSGDLDPSVPVLLAQRGHTVDQVDQLLNRASGLLGICGDNDMREIHARADAGDEAAELARNLATYRLRKYVGAYMAALGGLDVLVFTAGIGEHDAWIRSGACQGLDGLGIVIDTAVNDATWGPDDPVDLSAPESKVRILLVPTDEEHAIAEQAVTLAARG